MPTLAWAALLVPATAAAQRLPAGPLEVANGTLTIGAEATVTAGSRDDTTFFDYTDYEHNSLRMIRVAFSGMWRPNAHVAFLAQIRSEDADRVIADAYYARVRPWTSRAFDLQVGRIPPVFGTFARRSYATDNPLIGYPLAYQYLTSLRPDAIPSSADDLLAMRARGWMASYPVGVADAAPGVPLVSAYRWDTGGEASWSSAHFDAAGAVTLGTLSTPQIANDNGGLQYSSRVAWKPATALVIGASVARGEFLSRALEDRYAPVLGRHSYPQEAIGLDAEYSKGYWIVRGEAIGSRWTIPALGIPIIAGPLGAASGYVETSYQFTPRWFAAARVDTLTFSKVQGQRLFGGQPTTWDAPVSRIESGGGFYIQRNMTLRAVVQSNWRDGGRARQATFLSAQLSYWF
ncbi:MAG TPA: hypothetical protein VGL62_01955 [Vicinamibacterales bacterium]